MAPDGWKEGVTWVQISHPSNSTVGCGGHCSHLPSLARRSSRDCWKREARVGLPCPPPAWGSASWNRLPTSCGERGAELAHLPGLSIALPAAHPREPGSWRASPLSNSVWARKAGWGERVWRAGDPRRAAGGPGAGFGQAFPPQQGQGHPGFCLKTCEPARDNVGRGGKSKEGKAGCGGWSPCQMIQPLPSEL